MLTPAIQCTVYVGIHRVTVGIVAVCARARVLKREFRFLAQ